MGPPVGKPEYLLHAAIQELGWEADPKALAQRVQSLERGLPAEDEFSIILNWLGNCQLVHKLDQEQAPSKSRSRFQVPDLLVIFDYHDRPITVLVEVKTSDDNTLSWKPDYRDSLIRYADALGLPLLVAWKHRTIWVLFDASHFAKADKNFNISFLNAIKQSLLSELSGDFSFSFHEGVGLVLKMRKLEKKNDTISTVVERAFWKNSKGERITKVPGLTSLFLCSDNEAIVEEDDDYLTQSYVVKTDQDYEFAHRALVRILQYLNHEDKMNWRKLLLQDQKPEMLRGGLLAAAQQGLHSGFVKHIFHVRPTTMPQFLSE